MNGKDGNLKDLSLEKSEVKLVSLGVVSKLFVQKNHFCSELKSISSIFFVISIFDLTFYFCLIIPKTFFIKIFSKSQNLLTIVNFRTAHTQNDTINHQTIRNPSHSFRS